MRKLRASDFLTKAQRDTILQNVDLLSAEDSIQLIPGCLRAIGVCIPPEKEQSLKRLVILIADKARKEAIASQVQQGQQ